MEEIKIEFNFFCLEEKKSPGICKAQMQWEINGWDDDI